MKLKLQRNVILAVLSLAVLIQLTIISYNYYTGYIVIPNIGNFFIRLLFSTIFTFIFGLFIIFLDIQILNNLDKVFPLPNKLIPRIPSELILTVVAGIIVGTIVTLVVGIIAPYEEGLKWNIINNSLITIVINIIIMVSIEALLWFKRSQASLVKTERLERENMLTKFETLKSQLNPHFLFNSLNVLSSLIKKDSEKAQEFVDEFSSVYRYTLDVIDKPVVSLSEEIEFAKSFLYLQKIRFDDSIIIELNIDASKLSYLVPPLAVQTLLENSFKHNRVSADFPLKIKIFIEDYVLVITNNMQAKNSRKDSKGVGQQNLKKRYELLGDKLPQFTLTGDEYIAKIPLLKPE